MKVEFNLAHINRVDLNIAPPLRRCVTIPVSILSAYRDGKEVMLYIGESPFSPHPLTPIEFKNAVAAIAEQLEVREG